MPQVQFGSTRATMKRSGSVVLRFNSEDQNREIPITSRRANKTPPAKNKRPVLTGTVRPSSTSLARIGSAQGQLVERPSGYDVTCKEKSMRRNAEEMRTARLLEYGRKLEFSLYRSGEPMDTDIRETQMMQSSSQWWAYDGVNGKVEEYDNDFISDNSSSGNGNARGFSKSKHLRWFKSSTSKEQETKSDTGVSVVEQRMNRFVYSPAIDLGGRQALNASSSDKSTTDSDDPRRALSMNDDEIMRLGHLSQPYDSIHRRFLMESQNGGRLGLKEEEEEEENKLGAARIAEEEEEEKEAERIEILNAERQAAAEERAKLAVATAELATIGAKLKKQGELESRVLDLEEQLSALKSENSRLQEQATVTGQAAATAESDLEKMRQFYRADLAKRLNDQQQAEWRKKLVRGAVFIRHRSGTPHKCLVYCDKELENVYHANMGKLFGRIHHTSLPLAAVREVRNGIKTDILKRSANSEHVYGCLSLVGQDFTLDLELPFYPKDVKDGDKLVEENRNEWLKAFKWAVNLARHGGEQGSAEEGFREAAAHGTLNKSAGIVVQAPSPPVSTTY